MSGVPESLGVTWTDLLVGVGFFVVSAIGSLALVIFFVLRLPTDYFRSSFRPKPAGDWFARVGKNIVGGLLVVAGAIMSIPGVPGQGILTMLIGLMLIDFPGKRRLELKLVKRPAVLRGLNSLRARFKKPPLDLDP